MNILQNVEMIKNLRITRCLPPKMQYYLRPSQSTVGKFINFSLIWRIFLENYFANQLCKFLQIIPWNWSLWSGVKFGNFHTVLCKIYPWCLCHVSAKASIKLYFQVKCYYFQFYYLSQSRTPSTSISNLSEEEKAIWEVELALCTVWKFEISSANNRFYVKSIMTDLGLKILQFWKL